MAQTSRIAFSLSFEKTTAPDGGTGKIEQVMSLLANLASGTGTGQADVGFIDKARQLASNTSEDLDVAGSLTDAFGNSVAAAKIKALGFISDAANTTNLTIGGATAELQAFFAAAGDKLTVRPGEAFLFYSPTGWTVGAGSTDDIKVANAAGAAANFDIGFIGTSA